MGYLRKRFSEGSSYAGLSGLIPSLIGVLNDVHNAAAWGGLITGLLAILIPEKAAQ
jgi:hypothetical protein